MLLYLLILLILSMPIFDKYLTIYINKFNTKTFSYIFSKYIIYFNLIINIVLIKYIYWKIILFRYFIELFIINFCFKCLLDRPRPRDSLLKDNKYYGVTDIIISKNWYNNQSFPSGHVTTVYCTFRLINYLDIHILSLFYQILLILTIYSRINVGAHYLSDCTFAIFICLLLYRYV